MQIIAKGLTFTYNANSALSAHALRGVDLTVPSGSFFGIIGKTGSGKSTFVTHLNGLNLVQGGTLTVGETVLYSPKERKAQIKQLKKQKKGMDSAEYQRALSALAVDKKRLKRERIALREKVGMVFQYPEYQLFAETVFEDVAFALKNFAMAKKRADKSFVLPTEEEIADKVRTAMEYVGLNYEKYKDVSVFDLSGGQKRRVAIAGVLVAGPEVLVLDEPVAGLDPEGKAQLFDLLHTLHGRAVKTVVIVSHDMDDVAENCTHVAVFGDGKVLKTALTSQLFEETEFLVEAGMDLPVTAYLSHALKGQGVQTGGVTLAEFAKRTATALRYGEKGGNQDA